MSAVLLLYLAIIAEAYVMYFGQLLTEKVAVVDSVGGIP